MISKRKVIYFLVTVVAALLFINVLLGLTQVRVDKTISKEFTVREIEKKFHTTLDQFEINKLWIKKINLRKGKYDSLKYQYRIIIPHEVSIPVILKDLTDVLHDSNISLMSSERKVRGSTNLQIKYKDNTKLIVDFIYNSQIKREYSSIGFLITEFEEVSGDMQNDLFNITFPVGVLLPLEKESRGIAELIKSKQFEYFIELTSEANSSDFELNEDIGLEKLNKNIRAIISNFNSPEIFFLDKLNSGFGRSTKDFIIEEFKKRERRICFIRDYINLKGEDINDLKSLLNFHLNNLKTGNSKVFRLRMEDWFLIQDEISKYFKKGNKIEFPTSLL